MLQLDTFSAAESHVINPEGTVQQTDDCDSPSAVLQMQIRRTRHQAETVQMNLH